MYTCFYTSTHDTTVKKKKSQGNGKLQSNEIVAGGGSQIQDSEKHMDGLGGGLIG